MELENDNEELKWDLKINDWNKKFREYYQKHRANYKDLQMKQKFKKVIRWREYRTKCLDRRIETENTTL